MKKIAVVFYSGTGNTEEMAGAVSEGAKTAGSDVRIIHAESFTPEMMDSYDGVAFGCPSMGVEELEEEYFEPMFSSLEGKLPKKRIALFGSYGWGDGEWMRSWEQRTKDLGAILVSEPVITVEDPDTTAIAACKALGAALATYQ
ncbi:flavodoxin [Sphaerochaeta sp. PS]|uniref:flavodoxin n=1 Tax=Sphaerochaeta sp. PS TaxID=3076336 RepID=UPI0028A40C7E|nr:flavodoxin [Sphaerochaeta sp. PS]MDT4761608.1 flavodoxin [Sphaerochaeta sp. PS]